MGTAHDCCVHCGRKLDTTNSYGCWCQRPAPKTKQEEIDYHKAYVASLPLNSYLRSMFAGTVVIVEQMIRNDFGYDPLPELFDKQAEITAEMREERKRRDELHNEKLELEAEIKRMTGTRERVKYEIDQLKARAIAIGHC